jgi:molybdopterin molybdotransferase
MSGMRPLGRLVSLDEALRIIDRASKPMQRVETVPIWSAFGRILAVDVRAGVDVPSFNRSAMDGFAVRATDVKDASDGKPSVLKIVDKIFAGDVARKSIEAGQCVEIATGGMLPKGADAVVMVERTSERGRRKVAVLSPVTRGQNVIPVGEDIRKGAIIVRREDLLSPAKIGSIAAVGIDAIACYERPNVVVMPTGDEVVRPGERLRAGQVYDVNTFTLKSAVQSFGGQVDVREIVDDSKESLIRAISSEKTADIIIFSGGSSVGEKDLIVDAVSELGKVLFHGVAVRPGKPTLLGRVGKSLVLGMPGHPTSCLSNAYIFLEPMMAKIGRLPRRERAKLKLRMSADARLAAGRATVIHVRVDGDRAVPVFKESSAITSMTNADGYILVGPRVKSLRKGAPVEVALF